MNDILGFLYLLLLTLIGYRVSSFILGTSSSKYTKMGLAFGAGAAISACSQLINILFRIPNDFSVAIFVLLCVSGLAKNIRMPTFHKTRMSFFDGFLCVSIAALIIFVFFQAQLRPLVAWDGIASWFYGVKHFFISNQFDAEFYKYSDFDFPPFFHLVGASISGLVNSFDENTILLIFPFIYISLIILFYSSIREYVDGAFALIFTFLLASTQNLIRHAGMYDAGHIDIVLAYFLFGAFVLFINALKKKDMRNFLLAEVFIVIVALTKNEGLLIYFLSQAIVMPIFLKQFTNKSSILVVSALTFTPLLAWIIYKNINLPTNLIFLGSSIDWKMLPLLILYAFLEFFNIQRWNMGWIFILFTFPLWLKFKRTAFFALFFTILIAFYLAVYIVSPTNGLEYFRGSFDRLLLQLYPAALFVSIYSVRFVLFNRG